VVKNVNNILPNIYSKIPNSVDWIGYLTVSNAVYIVQGEKIKKYAKVTLQIEIMMI